MTLQKTNAMLVLQYCVFSVTLSEYEKFSREGACASRPTPSGEEPEGDTLSPHPTQLGASILSTYGPPN